MAGALRPVVVLMALASVLLITDGLLDGVYPGGEAWLNDHYYGLGWTSYLFAALNLVVAVLVARGSERSLIGRIGLSGFFLVERPLTAFVLGPKPPASVAVHAATALVELVILLGALRVWRLGRSFGEEDLVDLFSVGASAPVPAAAAPRTGEPAAPRPGAAWTVGILAMLLAGILVVDGVTQGYTPGGKIWGMSADSAGWLSYLFAIVVLTVSARAVRGGSVALRAQFAISLLLFIERSFSPFVVSVPTAAALALHGLAAFAALALALASAGALRGAPMGSRRLEVVA